MLARDQPGAAVVEPAVGAALGFAVVVDVPDGGVVVGVVVGGLVADGAVVAAVGSGVVAGDVAGDLVGGPAGAVVGVPADELIGSGDLRVVVGFAPAVVCVGVGVGDTGAR